MCNGAHAWSSTGPHTDHESFSTGNISHFENYGDLQYIEFKETDNSGKGLMIKLSATVNGDSDIGNMRYIAYSIKTKLWKANLFAPETKYMFDNNVSVSECYNATSEYKCAGSIKPNYDSHWTRGNENDGNSYETNWEYFGSKHFTLWSDAHPYQRWLSAPELSDKRFVYIIPYDLHGGSSDRYTNDFHSPYNDLDDKSNSYSFDIKNPIGSFEIDSDDFGKKENLVFTRVSDFKVYLDIANDEAFQYNDKKINMLSLSNYFNAETRFTYPRTWLESGNPGGRSRPLRDIFKFVYDGTTQYRWPQSVLFSNAFWMTCNVWDRSGRAIKLKNTSHVAAYYDNDEKHMKYISKIPTNEYPYLFDNTTLKPIYNSVMWYNYDWGAEEGTDETDKISENTSPNVSEFYIRAYWSPIGERVSWENQSNWNVASWNLSSDVQSVVNQDHDNHPITASGFVWVSSRVWEDRSDRSAVRCIYAGLSSAIYGGIFKMYWICSSLVAYMHMVGTSSNPYPMLPNGPYGYLDAHYETEE
jgi:hypothetical protein